MDKLNASPRVLRVLFTIAGVLYLIGSLFLLLFLPPTLTVSYAMSWLMLGIALGFVGVAWKIDQIIAQRNPIPYVLIVLTFVVRVVNGWGDGFGLRGQRVPFLGLAIGVVVGGYLWWQVRRLQQVAA